MSHGGRNRGESREPVAVGSRVLIAGCGYVGCELAGLLVDRGATVWGLARHPRGLPAGVRPLAADVTDPASLGDLPPGLDAVVYAVAAGGFTDESYSAAYATGPRHLLAALAGQGQAPERVIFTSSTAVYAQGGGEVVDETSPIEPRHFSGSRVLQGEAAFLDGPFPATVARLGGIYGPGRTRLLDRVAAGEAACEEGPPSYTNRIHRDDAAGALAHLLALSGAAPVYNVVDTEPAERCDVLRWIARRLGVAEPPVVAEREGGRPSRSNKRVSCTRLVRSGYAHHYPTFREGYGAMIGERRSDEGHGDGG